MVLKKKACAVAGAIVAALALAACSSATDSGTGSSSSSGAAASSSGSAAGNPAVTAALKTFASYPGWRGPTSSPPVAQSKFVIDIPCTQAAIGCSRPGDAFLEAAKAMGWKTQLIDPGGDPNKLQAAFRQAVQLGADGIFAPGGNISALGDSLKEAKAAGLKVITMAGEGNPVGPDAWDANVYENTLDYGKAFAAYIAANTPNANVLVVNDPEFAEIDAQMKQFKTSLAEDCPGCKVSDTVDFSIVDMATTMPQQVKAKLQADNSINWVVGPYDAASSVIVQAVTEIGRADSVKLISWGGHPQNLGFIKDGQVESATVAVGEEWIGYAAADQMNRLFNNQPIWTEVQANKGSTLGSENYPEQILDASTLPSDIKTPWNGPYDFRAAYMKLWGLS